MKNVEKDLGSSFIVVQNMDHKVHNVASTKGHDQLSTSEQLQLLGKSEASLEVAATQELSEGLLEER